MIVSTTLQDVAADGLGGVGFVHLLDACFDIGFDLDDFLFEIWKETRND